MLNSFNRIEDLEDFEEFVRQGIEKIASLAADERSRRDEEDEYTVGVKDLAKSAKKTNQIEDLDKLSTETYMKMKDILDSIKQWKEYLKTGLLTDDVYSTSVEDYLGKTLRPRNDEGSADIDSASLKDSTTASSADEVIRKYF